MRSRLCRKARRRDPVALYPASRFHPAARPAPNRHDAGRAAPPDEQQAHRIQEPRASESAQSPGHSPCRCEFHDAFPPAPSEKARRSAFESVARVNADQTTGEARARPRCLRQCRFASRPKGATPGPMAAMTAPGALLRAPSRRVVETIGRARRVRPRRGLRPRQTCWKIRPPSPSLPDPSACAPCNSGTRPAAHAEEPQRSAADDAKCKDRAREPRGSRRVALAPGDRADYFRNREGYSLAAARLASS